MTKTKPSSPSSSRRWRVAAAALLLLGGMTLGAADGDVARHQREQDLVRIRAEIVRLRGRLDRLARRENDLAGELEKTQVELKLQESRVGEAVAARDLAQAAAAETAATIQALEAEIEHLRTGLREGLSWLYRLGAQGQVRLLLSIQSRQDLLPAIRGLRFFARRNAEMFTAYLDTRIRLEIEQRDLDEQRRETESWADREEGRRRQLDRLRRQQSTLLAQLERQQRDLRGDAERLADKEHKLSNFIDFLYGRMAVEISGKPIQEFRGVLDWPVQGKVEQGFGPRRDSRYGTEVPHHGIDIATTAGDPVRVVYPGKVLFAAPFQGFGLTAIVHHSGRVFTLYAGLSSLSVSQNDVIPLGTVLGSTSDRLYLEIREENRPQDPVSWLR